MKGTLFLIITLFGEQRGCSHVISTPEPGNPVPMALSSQGLPALRQPSPQTLPAAGPSLRRGRACVSQAGAVAREGNSGTALCKHLQSPFPWDTGIPQSSPCPCRAPGP